MDRDRWRWRREEEEGLFLVAVPSLECTILVTEPEGEDPTKLRDLLKNNNKRATWPEQNLLYKALKIWLGEVLNLC